MTTSHSTIDTREGHTQALVINERRTIATLEDLQGHGRFAYRLLTTVDITSVGTKTFIDTLAKGED